MGRPRRTHRDERGDRKFRQGRNGMDADYQRSMLFTIWGMVTVLPLRRKAAIMGSGVDGDTQERLQTGFLLRWVQSTVKPSLARFNSLPARLLRILSQGSSIGRAS